jgi:hypothetical protein
MNEQEKAIKLAMAIGKVESGGNYNAKGGSGEIGAFQFMPSTWKSWAGQYLGNANAPLTKENQNKVAVKKVADLIKQGYNEKQIALIWNGGQPVVKKGVNQYGVAYDSGAYADKVLSAYNNINTKNMATKSLDQAINQARQTGSTDTDILEYLKTKNPSLGGKIDLLRAKAQETGRSDREVLNYLSKKTTGKEPTVQSVALSNEDKGGEETDFSLGETVRNIPSSAKKFGSDILSVFLHPIKTLSSVGKMGAGVLEKTAGDLTRKVTGVEQGVEGAEAEQVAENVGQFFKERYGNWNNIKKTIQEDPVGFLADLSTVIEGGGAVLRGVGTAGKLSTVGDVGKLSKISEAGKAVQTFGRNIDPLVATTKLVGGTLQKVGETKKLATFASKVDPAVLETAKRLEIDLPASAISKSKVVNLLETIGGRGFFGTRIADKVENAYTKLNDIADTLVKETNNAPDLTSAGKAVAEGFETYRKSFEEAKDAVYEVFNKDEIKEIKAVVSNTDTALKEILAQKTSVIGGGENAKFFKDKMDILVNPKTAKKLTFENLKQTRTEVGRRLKSRDPIVTGDQSLYEKLYAALSDDMDATLLARKPELLPQLQLANGIYNKGLETINSSFGKKITSLIDQPDKIVPSILNKSTSSEEIKRIYDIIGEENVPAVQANLLETIIQKAKGADGNFTKTGLGRELRKYSPEQLEAMFTPEQIKVLNDVDTLSQSLGKSKSIAEGSQTAFLGRIIGEIAVFAISPIKALSLILGDMAFSKFVTSKIGQKILTEGIEGGAIPRIEEMGTKIKQAGEKIKPALPASRVIYQIGRQQRLRAKQSENQ